MKLNNLLGIKTLYVEDIGFETIFGWLQSLYSLLLFHNTTKKTTEVLHLDMPAPSRSCKSLIKRLLSEGTLTHRDLRFHKESTEQNMETHPTSITSFLGYALFCGRCPKTTAYVLCVNNLISNCKDNSIPHKMKTCPPCPLHRIIRNRRKYTIVRKCKAHILLFLSILLEWVST